jgi:hypothetical protein
VGASNVSKVFAYWAHLNHRDQLALVFMANTALDADDPPRYFGGWEALARALGFDVSDERNAAEQVRRVLAALAKAGAVVSSSRARMNIRAEYALALEPAFTFRPSGTGREVTWEKVVRSSTEKVESSHQKGGTDPPKRWKVPTKKVPPMSSEDPVEEKRGSRQEERGTAAGRQAEYEQNRRQTA